jgi:hypothetical protein
MVVLVSVVEQLLVEVMVVLEEAAVQEDLVDPVDLETHHQHHLHKEIMVELVGQDHTGVEEEVAAQVM